MEVGEEVLAAADGVAGADEELGLGDIVAGGRVGEVMELAQAGLGGAEGGGADAESRALVAEGGEGGRGDAVGLAVHAVVGERAGVDGLEGAGADLEDEVAEAVAFGLQAGDQLRGEVEAGGRRGGGAALGGVGVDGLVARGVVVGPDAGGLAGLEDVGRQGNLAALLGELVDGAAGRELEADEELAAVAVDGARPPAPLHAEPDGLAGALGGAKEAPPLEGIGRGAEEEALDLAAGGAETAQAGVEDADAIAQQGGGGGKDGGKVGEGEVLDGAAGATDDEETGGVAARGRDGRDAVGRQEVIEVGGLHPFSRRCAGAW